MKAEFFKILKEINSLEIKLNGFDDLKAEDKKRIDRLKQHKKNKINELKDLNSNYIKSKRELLEIESELLKVEKLLQNISDQRNSSFDKMTLDNLDTKQSELELKNEDLQNRGLQLIDEEETSLEEIKITQSFLGGIDETINEIFDEIKEEQGKSDISENLTHQRIESLLNDLQLQFKNNYLKLKQKVPTHQSLSIISKGRCGQCHYQISPQKLENIEKKYELYSCEMCKRILIPSHCSY